MPLQAASSFDVEFQSLLHGLQLAVPYSDHIWVELDAATVVSVLTVGVEDLLLHDTPSALFDLCAGIGMS